MTTSEYGQARYLQLEEELDLFNEMGISPVQRLTGILKCVSQALSELKGYLLNHPFVNQQEEINFFKHLKPKFYAWHIYALEVYTIETEKPIGDELLLKSYYEQEFKYIKRFFSQNQLLYQYFKLGASDMDILLFIRGAQRPSLLTLEYPDMDPDFSTVADYLFSRFIAFEHVQEFLITSLHIPGNMDAVFRQSKKGRILKWTGDKTNLVELAYGIYDTLQINEGKVDLSDIIDWFEQSLQVNLSRYYRRFSEIKMRKSMSKTRYLDEMTAALHKHIEEGDTFRPNH